MKKLMIIFICLIGPVVFARNTPGIVEKAMKNIQDGMDYSYSFKKVTKGKESSRVMTYNPTLDEEDQWELVSIDNRKPNRKELKKFYKKMSRISDKDNKNSMEMSADEMYDFSICNEDDNQIVYQCRMNDEKNKKMMEKVLCELVINKQDSTMNIIRMNLTEPVSPMISVKLDEFDFEMKFQTMVETGANLIEQTRMKIKGKALIFKKIDENVTEKYYDYQLQN